MAERDAIASSCSRMASKGSSARMRASSLWLRIGASRAAGAATALPPACKAARPCVMLFSFALCDIRSKSPGAALAFPAEVVPITRLPVNSASASSSSCSFLCACGPAYIQSRPLLPAFLPPAISCRRRSSSMPFSSSIRCFSSAIRFCSASFSCSFFHIRSWISSRAGWKPFLNRNLRDMMMEEQVHQLLMTEWHICPLLEPWPAQRGQA